jgi:hypothetical protein
LKRLFLFLLLPALALAARGDWATKSTTIAADTDACTTPADTDCTAFGVCSAASSGGLCGAADEAFKIGDFDNVALTITNTGATNVLSDVLVLMSDDGTNYEVWDSTTFDELATTTTKSMQISGNSRRFLKVIGRSNAGTTVKVGVAVTSP